MLFFNIDDKLSVEIVKGSVAKSELIAIESKKLYPADIKKNLNERLALFVIDEQLKALRSKGHVVSKNTLEMNRLVLSEKVLIALIEMLIDSDLAFFNRKKIKVESFKVDFIFKCKKLNETLEVCPFIDVKNILYKACDCNIVGSFAVVVDKGLYLFKEAFDKRWLKFIKQSSFFLEKREAKYFLEDFNFQINFKTAQKKQPNPALFLTDQAGVLAKLKFKYDDEIFEGFSNEGDHVRNYEIEKAFQSDLDEVGYKKKLGLDVFYCPQPHVFEALKLLIEIGWEVFNYEKKKIIFENKGFVEVKKDKATLKLNAKISFSSGELLGTEDIFQACLKKQNFFDLGEKVALFDNKHYEKKLKVFLEEQKTALPIVKIGAVAEVDSNLEQSLFQLKETLIRKRKFPEVKLEDNFVGKLFNYQKIGLNWLTFLYKLQFGALLADEMGLGKTVQVLAFFAQLRNFCPVLIVAPKSLITNWKSEFNRFLPTANVEIYYGADRSASFTLNSFILTTYGTLREDAEKLSHIQFECVVLDESSFIKNDKTKSNKAAAQLKSFFKICLNGTPIENSVNDLVSQFNFLIPNLINAKLSNEKIYTLIAPFLLKRTKESVEIDLPAKSEQIVYVELEDSQKLLYEETLTEARAAFSSKEAVNGKQMHVFEALLRLRQICCDPALIECDAPSAKLQQVLKDIESVAATHKILIFSQFTKMLKKIRGELSAYKLLYLDGKTSIAERQKAVIDFQENSEPCIFLMSLKAASYGLNLQSADYVFIFDPWWNEAVENQAIDRAHRIGRSRSLIAKRYLTIDTIEEKIYRLKLDKLKTCDNFIPQNLNTDDLYHLLH